MNLLFGSLIFLFAFSMISISYSQNYLADPISPRDQLLLGVSPFDVKCKADFQLIFKATNSMPVCVSSNTAQKLFARSWAVTEFTVQSSTANTSTIDVIPATSSTRLNFYLNDDDLNLNPNGSDVVSTAGLIQVTINGVSIDIPSSMSETSPSSGRFVLVIDLPDSINGKALSQNDIILIQYFDETDNTGSAKTVSSSVKLSQTFASFKSSGGTRIGHEFNIRIYEPDANRDSKNEDKISLGLFEFRVGGLRTTLANPTFDAKPSYLLETGPNTDIFEVTIKIPRTIDGRIIHIGDSYEIRYIDGTTPSGTSEKVKLKGTIG